MVRNYVRVLPPVTSPWHEVAICVVAIEETVEVIEDGDPSRVGDLSCRDLSPEGGEPLTKGCVDESLDNVVFVIKCIVSEVRPNLVKHSGELFGEYVAEATLEPFKCLSYDLRQLFIDEAVDVSPLGIEDPVDAEIQILAFEAKQFSEKLLEALQSRVTRGGFRVCGSHLWVGFRPEARVYGRLGPLPATGASRSRSLTRDLAAYASSSAAF